MWMQRHCTSALCGIVANAVLQSAVFATGVDDFDQISVSEAAKDAPAALASLSSELKLSAAIDVGSAFDDGTLISKVRAITPMAIPGRLAPESNVTAPTLREDEKAFIASATKWVPNNLSSDSGAFTNLQGRLNIKVCWLNPDNADAANVRGRLLTKASITATWEYYSKVSFVGWQKCLPNARGIKIQIADDRPKSQIGNLSDSHSPSMTLNFKFDHPEMAGCKSKIDLCIHSIAVHEFGHALGFLHEQDSPDTPKWCKRRLGADAISKPLESLQAKMVTDWDRFSVMDYCFDIYSQRIQLSDCDIAAVQATYQKPSQQNYEPKCIPRVNP